MQQLTAAFFMSVVSAKSIDGTFLLLAATVLSDLGSPRVSVIGNRLIDRASLWSMDDHLLNFVCNPRC